MSEVKLPNWLRYFNIILGFAAFIIAIWVLAYPELGTAWGIILLGIFFIVKALFRSVAKITYEHHPRWQQALSIIIGILLIAFGLPIILLPGIGITYLTLLLALALTIIGIDLIITGFVIKTYSNWRRSLQILLGFVLIIVGVVDYFIFGLGYNITLWVIAFGVVIIGLDALIQGVTGYRTA